MLLSHAMSAINSKSCTYCYLDLDFNNHRSKLKTAAVFVDATNSRYGFSSKDLRHLGGSEISRIQDLIATDHEWSSKNTECGGIEVRAPQCGGRIVVRLYWDVAPLACENFASLCGNGGNFPPRKKPKPPPVGESGKPLSYRNSVIHRVVPGFIMQGGDFVFGNGSGGESIYNGKKFKDERAGLALKHNKKGILSMGNSGKNSNTSQFFFTLKEAPQCDGKHVAFGEVVSGFEVLDEAEKYGSSDGNPSVPINITDCGIFIPFETPAAGYWYDQPDADSYAGSSPVFMVRPRVAVVVPTEAVLERFQKAMGNQVVVTSVTVNELGNDEAVATRLMELLEAFAVDVVLVAPICFRPPIDSIKLPASWADQSETDAPSLTEVMIQVKPVHALMALGKQSWLVVSKRKSWHMDGAYNS